MEEKNLKNNLVEIDIKGIMELIPHRYPFLLVDRILEIESGKSIIGLKNVTFNEQFFIGHFPTEPVMPGVLIIEAMAQVSALLVAHDNNKFNSAPKVVYFMSIEEAKFRKAVTPGDTLIIKSELLQARSNVWKFGSKTYVADNLVSEAQFTAMIKEKSNKLQ